MVLFSKMQKGEFSKRWLFTRQQMPTFSDEIEGKESFEFMDKRAPVAPASGEAQWTHR
jgi:hypothetical protein